IHNFDSQAAPENQSDGQRDNQGTNAVFAHEAPQQNSKLTHATATTSRATFMQNRCHEGTSCSRIISYPSLSCEFEYQQTLQCSAGCLPVIPAS
ncbi:hypothetical protein, partial [Klebsiella variicola]|uniref:hypothetical protein n=1 Tax=Klebsiella variicola TaxID=244366 RepID=UPI001C449BEA